MIVGNNSAFFPTSDKNCENEEIYEVRIRNYWWNYHVTLRKNWRKDIFSVVPCILSVLHNSFFVQLRAFFV